MNSRQITAITIVTLISVFLFFGPAPLAGEKSARKNSDLWHFWASVDENDNHRNWANHTYAFNMMRTTEPNAIFMTEGGDNQVFGLLYFSYVERLRPDVDFYDQKGNVFPRLYGDLMNTWPDDLNMIRDLRDFQLFSTGRPIYLCWKRPGLEDLRIENLQNLYEKYSAQAAQNRRPMRPFSVRTLAEVENTLKNLVPREVYDQSLKNNQNLMKQHLQYLGPWYMQRFGILYRVTPIRYAFVDALDLYRKASKDEIKAYVQKVANIMPSDADFDKWSAEAAAEGLIKKDGSQWRFIKMYPTAFSNISLDGYWDNYDFDYTNVPNAKDWDYLTREIFANYNFQEGQYSYDEQRQYWLNRYNNDRENPRSQSYLANADRYYQRALNSFERACEYGNEMFGTFYNHALFLNRENKLDEAVKYYLKSIDANDSFYPAWQNIGQIYVNRAMTESSAVESSNLMKAKEAFENAIEAFERAQRKQGREDQIQVSQDWRRLDFVLRQIKGMLEVPKKEIELQSAKAQSGDIQELIKLASLQEKRLDLQGAAGTYDRLSQKQSANIEWPMSKYRLFTNIDTFQANQFLAQIVIDFGKFKGADPMVRFNACENLGSFHATIAEELIQQMRLQESIQEYQRSGYFFSQMVQQAMQGIDANGMRRAQQAQNQLGRIQQRITQITNYMSRMKG